MEAGLQLDHFGARFIAQVRASSLKCALHRLSARFIA
jgi:hypothetical protein